jgi:hypothetical protein
MAHYAILLYQPTPGDPDDLSPEEREAHSRYANQIEEELGGKLIAPHALRSSTMATSVRGDMVTDGPFIEAKEVIAGFFVLEARDLDHALKIAKLCPANWQGGGVEVRPIAAGSSLPPTP